MFINTLTNVIKLYLIVKRYQFIIQINVFGTQNVFGTLSHYLISYTKKYLNDTFFLTSPFVSNMD